MLSVGDAILSLTRRDANDTAAYCRSHATRDVLRVESARVMAQQRPMTNGPARADRGEQLNCRLRNRNVKHWSCGSYVTIVLVISPPR